MAIAADDFYVYLAADVSTAIRGGSKGASRLHIGKFRPQIDGVGLAPTAAIAAPVDGATVYEGASLTVKVDAHDDFTVASVSFLIDKQLVFTSTSAPYQYTFTVPAGTDKLELGATARDLNGNDGAATPISISISPDPMTQAVGQVVNISDGTPLAGALISAPGGRTGTTDADGRFRIQNIPTVLGDLVLQASYTSPDGSVRRGFSSRIPSIPAGTTDMGQISVLDNVRFETDYGKLQTCTACDRWTLPFPVKTFGVAAQKFMLSYGDLLLISDTGRGSQIFALADGMVSGFKTFINDTLPDRYVITQVRNLWYEHNPNGTDTVQFQLFRNGSIVIAYKGIGSLSNNLLTGIVPPAGLNRILVDFSSRPDFDITADYAILEYFDRTNHFDLDNGFIIFTPIADGGYNIRTILPPPLAPSTILSGAVTATTPQVAPTQLRASALRQGRALTGSALANAEVHVSSSGNPHYRGMTNTDAQGRFTLAGVPPGGISVEVWRNGTLLARGSGISIPDKSGSEQLHIELVSPEVWPRD